jgi:hypothetical protein
LLGASWDVTWSFGGRVQAFIAGATFASIVVLVYLSVQLNILSPARLLAIALFVPITRGSMHPPASAFEFPRSQS